MELLSIHTFGMANYLMSNEVNMKRVSPNKYKKEMVYYFEDTPKARRLMREYPKQK